MVACLLMLAFIPPVINAHGYSQEEDGEQIGKSLDLMKLWTWIFFVIFTALLLINGLVWRIFERKERKRAEVTR